MRINQHHWWRAYTIAACLILQCSTVNAQATDDELLAFAQGRFNQYRITQQPVLIDYYVMTFCVAPQTDPRDKISPHWQKAIHVYSDQKGLGPMWDPYEKFPEGSVLLKEKFDPWNHEQIELFTGMLKREKDFAPEVGDWEFFTIDGTATHVTSRGKLDSCIACHRDYADSDFVTKTYAAKGSIAFRKKYQDAVWIDDKWVLRFDNICNGSLETVFLPASLAETRGKSKSRAKAVHAWSESVRPAAGKELSEAPPQPEDLSTFGGPTLRYEPVPHKNTLGYWTSVDDSASWQIAFDKPGRFKVNVLQGCGKGSGGAIVSVSMAGQSLKFEVQDTGGFQEFVWREIGEIEVKEAGRLELVVQPKTKPGVAVMDLRQIRLKRVR